MIANERSPIATLFPGYFALTMATGIVAIGASLQTFDVLANTLFMVALAAFVVLAVLSAARLIRYPKALISDLTQHRSGFSFLTLVAALNVLGSGAAVIHQWWTFAWVAWVAGVAFWLALVYPPLIGVIIGEAKPEFAEGINGTWFLLTVSTESVAVLGALLLGHRNEPSQLLELTVLAAFTLGLVLYLIVMTLLFLRWTFYPVGPDDLQPPSWIAAGALAITVLAGANLLAVRQAYPRVDGLAPFLEGMVILAWATATFWFPVMIAMGIWRHFVKRVPLRYHPAYWSLVFPIGMYGVATYRMIAVTGLDDLDVLPQLALTAALIAWTAALVGLVVTLLRGASSARRVM
ncbi:MAG: tellurite resistance/C4-dicarboxylate transporter family protein [Acidimicrobiales bacterium]|jgi:tellurite resistance protein TehA-like permease|nr:tellurite resistance/C4-dicarboxylate transporter family protein [Acidimicrobiales bacterium]